MQGVCAAKPWCISINGSGTKERGDAPIVKIILLIFILSSLTCYSGNVYPTDLRMEDQQITKRKRGHPAQNLKIVTGRSSKSLYLTLKELYRKGINGMANSVLQEAEMVWEDCQVGKM
jgi:hypothetical protein